MVGCHVGVIVVVRSRRAQHLTLVGWSVYTGPAKMYSRSKSVGTSARSSLGQICEVHLTLTSAGTVTRTSFFSTHHYHGVEVIGPVDEVTTSILLRIMGRLVCASLRAI